MEPVPPPRDPLAALQPAPLWRGVLPRGPDQLFPQLCQQPETEQDLHAPHVPEAAQHGVRGKLAVTGRPSQVIGPHTEVGQPGNHEL